MHARYVATILVTLLTSVGALCHAAGNVTVGAAHGALVVTGDAAANAVRLFPSDDGDGLAVEPLDASTTVNGGTAAVVVPVPRALRVLLGGGDDVCVVEDAELPGPLDVVGDVGDDQITLDDAHVGGTVRLFGGDGADGIEVTTSGIGGRLLVQTDAGDDHVVLDLASIAGRLKLSTGTGNDVVDVAGGTLCDADVDVATASGNDAVTVEESEITRALHVALSDGDDAVTLRGATLGRTVSLNGGDGVDRLIDAGGNTAAQRVETKKFEASLAK
jgi:hypothetical protein